MSTYLYCSQPLISNIAIPELPQTNDDKRRLFFNLENDHPKPTEFVWLHHWFSPSGEKFLSYSKRNSFDWLRFPDLADFRISANKKEIFCYPLPKVPLETIRHLLLDQVLPRCLAYQGKIMLHASAVKLEKGGILFIGESGAGKSTLAGNFHQAGIPVLSDDCVWVKQSHSQTVAIPTYGGLRLWDDSVDALFAGEMNIQAVAHYSAKKRVPLNESDMLALREGVPILALIMLSPPFTAPISEVTLESLPRREAFITMLKQSFHLNVMDFDRIKRYSRTIGSIVSKLPAYRLHMPRDYALLPLVRQKILEAVL